MHTDYDMCGGSGSCNTTNLMPMVWMMSGRWSKLSCKAFRLLGRCGY